MAIIARYPTLLARRASGAPKTEIADVIAASAGGYPFPTHLELDLDQPIGSLNPETQAELCCVRWIPVGKQNVSLPRRAPADRRRRSG